MYQALYRKWRPRTFDDVVGQKHITETLKNQVSSGRLSHAYLFTGTRGTGKTSCAKILAKAVNCESPVNGNPCNRCPACLGIDDGSVMDVVEMDAASNNGVDNVRTLRDEAVFSPASVKKRVYIVDEVHMLSVSAFNALLKILEEPPEHLMFILATTELQKVPATILSRCQRHSFKRLDLASISGRLTYIAQQEGIPLEPEAADLIARLADGSMRDAVSMLDQCSGRDRLDVDTVYSALGLAGRQKTVRLLESIARHETYTALELFSALWREGKDPATLLGELSGLQRDILISRVAPKNGGELLTGGYDAGTIAALSKLLGPAELIKNIQTIQQSLADMRNGQVRTVCELCIITMSSPESGGDVGALSARVERLEAAVSGGAATPQAKPVRNEPPRRAEPAKSETVPSSQTKQPQSDDRPAFDAAPPADDDRPPFDMTPPPADDDRPPFDMTPPPEREPWYPQEPVREAPRREQPQVREAPKPEKAAPTQPDFAPASSASGEWQQVLVSLKGQLPAGIMALITDPLQVSGEFIGDELRIYAAPGFAMNNLNRPDVTERIRSAVAAAQGRSVTVKVQPTGSSPAPAAQFVPKPAPSAASAEPKRDKLDELGRFGIVQFK